ncbi:hypothetical protein GCM10028895_22360 [Pontibacter rugosus]
MKLDEEALFEQEVEELMEQIHQQYGYDFRGYSRASLYRRIKRFASNSGIESMAVLKESIASDSYFFEGFLQEITVNVTEMFRDPSFFCRCARMCCLYFLHIRL